MIKRTRGIWFWLLVVAISSLVSGCGNGSSSNEGASTIITVTDYSGIRIPNATVVLGDSNGAMQTYGVTDANGQITFPNAPADATVTAGTTCLRSGPTITTYSINVQYDVNGSTVLTLDNCSSPFIVLPGVGSAAAELGTLTVNVTDIPSDVKQNQITVGRQVFATISGLITTKTLTISTNDLNMDGTFSIVVTGKDAAHNLIAYGVMLNQTFTDGMTIDIPMVPVSYVQYQVSNIPAAAVALRPSVNMYSTGTQAGFSWDYSNPLLSAPSSTTIDVPYIPGLGNEVSCRIDVDLDQDHDGVVDSSQSLSFESLSNPLSNQSFDLSKALSAPYVMVTGADTATPTLSWSGVDPAAPHIYFGASMRSSTTVWYLGLGNLIRSRTSIRYPELPDSLAAFRPNKVDHFSVYTSAFEGSLYKSSSGSYQAPNP